MPGGLALLAESPELVGAEPYVLANCRSLEIARKFLMMCLDLCLIALILHSESPQMQTFKDHKRCGEDFGSSIAAWANESVPF